jgi:hypothetical protein
MIPLRHWLIVDHEGIIQLLSPMFVRLKSHIRRDIAQKLRKELGLKKADAEIIAEKALEVVEEYGYQMCNK